MPKTSLNEQKLFSSVYICAACLQSIIFQRSNLLCTLVGLGVVENVARLMD